MAGIAYVRKRMYNPEVLVDPLEVFGKNGRMLKMEDPDGGLEPMYEIRWTGATQVGEELGTAATSAKDGTTTPYLINIASTDVADDWDNLAGAVRAVALLGISTTSLADYAKWIRDPESAQGQMGKPRTTVEVVKTNGVGDVFATRYWIWHDAIYACLWGTGAADATGIITSESPANTNLLVLSATFNEGEGGTWHFPPDKSVHTHHVTVNPTATFAAGDGCVLSGAYTSFDQALNTDPDLNTDFYTYTSNGGSVDQSGGLDVIHRFTTINSKVLWSEALIASSIVYNLHIIQSMH